MGQATVKRNKKLVSDVELGRRWIALAAEKASVTAATVAVDEAMATLAKADAQIERLKVVLREATIHAPTTGGRIVEKDAVVPAGGQIASLLDPSDVYMTVCSFHRRSRAG
jgi:HlyD family secretion protein